METLDRNDNIAFSAIQRSRPGPTSWLALILFVGSLTLAFDLRFRVIELIEYRELFTDAAVLGVISEVTLWFGVVLAVAGSIMAWRVWWTLSLIGTSILGMPDVAAIGAGRILAGSGRSASTGAYLAGAFLRELGRLEVGFACMLGRNAALVVSLLVKIAVLAGNRFRAVVVEILSFLRKILIITTSPFLAAGAVLLRYLLLTLVLGWGLIALTGSVAFRRVGRGAGFVIRYLWLAISATSLAVLGGLEFVAQYLWLAISSTSLAVWRGGAFVARYLWLAVSAASLAVWRGQRVVNRYVWLAVSASFFFLGRGVEITAKYFWLVISSASFIAGRGLQITAGYLWLAVRATSLFTWQVVKIAAMQAWLTVKASSLFVGRGVKITAVHVWLVFRATSLFMWLGVEVTAGHVWLAVRASSLFTWQVVKIAAMQTWLTIRASSLFVGLGVEIVSRYVWLVARATSLFTGRGLEIAAKYLWMAIFVLYTLIGYGIARSIKTLWTSSWQVCRSLGKGGAAVCRPVFAGVANIVLQVWESLVFASRCFQMITSAALNLVGKGATRGIASVWGGVSGLWLALMQAGTAFGKPVLAGIVSLSQLVEGALISVGNGIWVAISVPIWLLIKGTVRSFTHLRFGAFWLWSTLGHIGNAASKVVMAGIVMLSHQLVRVLISASNGLWVAISAPVELVLNGMIRLITNLWDGACLLLTTLSHGARFTARTVSDTLTIIFRGQSNRLRGLERNVRLVLATLGRDLVTSLESARRFFTWAMERTITSTKWAMTSGVSSLAMTVAILLVSPLLALRMVWDRAFRQEVAARFMALVNTFWARRAAGLVGIGVVLALGLTTMAVRGIFWPSQPVVEVIIWTSEEKQNVLLPSLKEFNEHELTVKLDGRRYKVRARSVAVGPAEMRAYLVAKINDGTDSPARISEPPTVFSPVTSRLLRKVNEDSGRNVFQLEMLRPVVRTPVVIFTRREMAECLGWPEQPVGWADVIGLAESPDGWSACPTARPEWGKKALIALPDPDSGSAYGSIMQILRLIDAGKSVEELPVSDVDDSGSGKLAYRYQAAVDHYYSETSELLTRMSRSPDFAHFAPVEEYDIARFHEDRATGGQAPGGTTARSLGSELGYDAVAIYPKEGTLWHDNPFAIPDVPWVKKVQREAAYLVEDYLRSGEVQARFMESGFRPGIYVEPDELLIPPQGLDFKQPEVILGQVSTEADLAIQKKWETSAGVFDIGLDATVFTSSSVVPQRREESAWEPFVRR